EQVDIRVDDVLVEVLSRLSRA
ncbi:MAG: hypothetical protein QOD59_4636, partial [Mycobacterium sp.]|nr:hypothetical protein [Mycobacterium sp.]